MVVDEINLIPEFQASIAARRCNEESQHATTAKSAARCNGRRSACRMHDQRHTESIEGVLVCNAAHHLPCNSAVDNVNHNHSFGLEPPDLPFVNAAQLDLETCTPEKLRASSWNTLASLPNRPFRSLAQTRAHMGPMHSTHTRTRARAGNTHTHSQRLNSYLVKWCACVVGLEAPNERVSVRCVPALERQDSVALAVYHSQPVRECEGFEPQPTPMDSRSDQDMNDRNVYEARHTKRRDRAKQRIRRHCAGCARHIRKDSVSSAHPWSRQWQCHPATLEAGNWFLVL